MNKVVIVVCLIGLLGAVVLAAAGPPDEKPGAIRIELEPTAAAPEGASGFVIINEPDDTGRYVVIIQVRGLEGGQWIAWGVGTGWRVGEFQCNRVGNGHDEVNLDEIGNRVNVKAIDGPGGNGPIIFTGEIAD